MRRSILIAMACYFLFVVTGCSNTSVKEPLDKANQNLVIYLENEKLEHISMSVSIGEPGLPVKELTTKLGFSIIKNASNKLTIDTGKLIEFHLGKEKVFIDGKKCCINTPAVQFEKELYVSAQELSKMLGFEYRIENNKIEIVKKPLN